jgi:hypothetical protein
VEILTQGSVEASGDGVFENHIVVPRAESPHFNSTVRLLVLIEGSTADLELAV